MIVNSHVVRIVWFSYHHKRRIVRRGRALGDSFLKEIFVLSERWLKMNWVWIYIGLDLVGRGESDVVFQGSAVAWNI